MNDNLNDIHANCEEEAAALRSQLRELQAQLDYEQERNLNSAANAQLQIKELTVERDNWYDACIRAHTRIAELTAELSRLRSGGCAREQGATQYCGEMQALVNRLTKLAAAWGYEREDEKWNMQKDTLRYCAGRLREAIAANSGEGER